MLLSTEQVWVNVSDLLDAVIVIGPLTSRLLQPQWTNYPKTL